MVSINVKQEAHILVVEDEQPIRRVIALQLQRSGFSVCEASCGKEAFQHISEREPDLVVLDIRLPDVSGFDICQRLRDEYPDIGGTARFFQDAIGDS